MSSVAEHDPKVTRESRSARWRRMYAASRWVGPALGLVLIWGLFAIVLGPKFMSWSNQRMMLLQTAVVGTAAVGATVVIISGGIDLSVGSAIALGTMIIAALLQRGWSPWFAASGAIVLGFVLGLVVGLLVTGRVGYVVGWLIAGLLGLFLARISPPFVVWPTSVGVGFALSWLIDRALGPFLLSPFIVTLAMWGALRGLAKGIGDNQPIYPDPTWLTQLMETSKSGITSYLVPGVWIMLGLALVVSFVLRYTCFGRHVYAIGANELAARLCGVPVEWDKRAIYGLAAACTGVAAIMQFAFLNGQGDPITAEGYELKVIASVVIGGASLSGGEGVIAGTLFGALIMSVVDNGCTKLGLDNWVQEIVTGGIILTAVSLDRLRQRTSA